MINSGQLITSLRTTLKADAQLLADLKTPAGREGCIVLGPDFPPAPAPRFVSIAVIANSEDTFSTVAEELTVVGLTIGVQKDTGPDANDWKGYSAIARRLFELLAGTTSVNGHPSSVSLSNDLVAHIARSNGIAPSYTTVGSGEYLVGQERYELLSFSV